MAWAVVEDWEEAMRNPETETRAKTGDGNPETETRAKTQAKAGAETKAETRSRGLVYKRRWSTIWMEPGGTISEPSRAMASFRGFAAF